MDQKEIEKMTEEYAVNPLNEYGRASDLRKAFIAGANAMLPEMERLKKENAELIERVIQLEKTVDENIESIITNNT